MTSVFRDMSTFSCIKKLLISSHRSYDNFFKHLSALSPFFFYRVSYLSRLVGVTGEIDKTTVPFRSCGRLLRRTNVTAVHRSATACFNPSHTPPGGTHGGIPLFFFFICIVIVSHPPRATRVNIEKTAV